MDATQDDEEVHQFKNCARRRNRKPEPFHPIRHHVPPLHSLFPQVIESKTRTGRSIFGAAAHIGQ
jgi:hypothetical protein